MAPDHRSFVTKWSDAETPGCVYLRDLEDNELRAIAASKPQMMRPSRWRGNNSLGMR